MQGGDCFYVSRHKEPTLHGATRRTVGLPDPASVLIGRLLDDLWLVNRYFTPDGGHQLLVCASQGHKLIQVRLEAGERVRFKVRHLVGWSSSIRMHTDISLAIVRIANKAIFVQEAVGPGCLLFEACGNPLQMKGNQQRFSADRLIAWSAATTFEISGAHTFADLYLNPPLVSIMDDGSAIMDSDDTRHSLRRSLVRMIRRFYLPW